MKKLFTRSRQLLFVIAALFMGANSAWADAKTLPYSYGFEDYNLATDGWTTQNPSGKNSSEFAIAGAAKKTGSYGFRFSSYSDNGVNTQYLLSPELDGANGVILSFWYAASSTSGTETFKVGYSTTGTNVETDFTWGDEISYKSTSWAEYTSTFPAGTKYVAVYYYANYQYRLYVDDFTFESPEVFEGPALKMFDGETAVATSGYSYNFGLALAGAEKSFTLKNPGTEAVTVNISATGGFGVSPATATIAAGEEATMTVSMAEATANGTVTITPTAEGVDAYTINVSGTLRDPNKLYLDFADGQMPEGWTSVKTGSYDYYDWTAQDGYAQFTGGSSYKEALTSPKLTFAAGENVFFEVARYGGSSYTPGLTVEFSADGSNWTVYEGVVISEENIIYGTWTPQSVTIPSADVKYIRFNGYYIYLRNIYGGELPQEPKMVVTQPASLDFGAISETATKTFTIANTGRATLNGITVTSSNNAVFTITGAPTSLEAGASQEVTITMGTAQTGALSSEITVSATDMEDVKFTVTGAVVPADMPKEEFTNGLPADWANSGWTFTNGIATAKSSSTMTTPKLVFAEGGLLVIKIMNYDNDATNSITIKGSTDNGTTWSYNNKIESANFLSNSDWTTLVISDIPSTVNKLQFVGFYCKLDEVAGLYYAPELKVTKDNETVTSPASYDFGEKLTADATVTYSFVNVGAGTLNITDVAIAGDGAGAYSTNWTEGVAAPFDLVITRSYDGTRTGVQEAVVTVTTTEGDFVINVSGSDQGLNAPEMEIDATPIDFGKLVANGTKTITVTNAGTGLLTVNIASDNELFTVSPAELTGIAAGESKTFDVTFHYDNISGYGAQNASITVTPTYDEAANMIISAMAYAKDPNVWSEEFADDPTVERGWSKEGSWSFADGKAVTNGYSGYLTTPNLTVAGTTDKLTFEYEATTTNAYIEYSYRVKGSDSWTKQYFPANYDTTYNGFSNGEMGTLTITGLAAGVYEFRFKAGYYKLDNFEGFKLFFAEHDAEITAQNIPTTGYVGNVYTATATVLEKAGKAETGVEAKLYIGNDVVASDTQDLTANGEATFALTFTPTEAISGTAKIVVTYEDVTLNSATATVNIKAIDMYDENSTENEIVTSSGYNRAIQLNRTFINGWNTVCLPIQISYPNSVTSFFGNGVMAYEFSYYSAENGLQFSSVTEMTAGKPYLLWIPESIDVNALSNMFLEDMWVPASAATPIAVTNGDVTFQGTYQKIAAGGDLTGNYILTTDAKIAKASAKASLKGFRAYFTASSGARMTVKFDDGTTTGIGFITSEGEIEVGSMYNLQGQKVQGTQKGLYIINGKKVVRK